MDLDLTHPAISDLRRRARRRIPHFAFEYLDSGTGSEAAVRRNRAALDAILFMPAILRGPIAPDLSTRFMDREHGFPFGIAPIGMAGSVWPGAEVLLARAGARHAIPYCQSTVAAAAPEDTGALAGAMGWFQHYPAIDPEIRRDMLARIRDAGFHTLVLTVDLPGESRRERQRRAHLDMPPRLTPRMVASMALSPAWAWAAARAGAPRMKFIETYAGARGLRAFQHGGKLIRAYPDWDYFRALREEWDGPLVAKGVLEPGEAVRLMAEGADAIWVSNHAGRQFEAAPAAIDRLPSVRAALGPEVPVIFDSGLAGGLDILRALALGADFVFLGRAFMYAVAAFGARGIDHAVHILREDMTANMAQIGARSFADLPARLIRAAGA